MKKLSDLDLNKKKYIIFDIDGTLIDSIGVWNLTDQTVIKNLTNKTIDLKKLQSTRENFIKKHNDKDIYLEYCGYLIKKYKINLDKNKLLELRWKISGNILTNEIDYKENAPELLKMLKEKNYTLAIASSTAQAQIDIYTKKNKKMLKQVDMLKTFDYILKKEDVKKNKPDPEIYLKIINHYKAKPEECLVFEDSLTGIISAKKAGLEVICIYDKYSNSDRKEIRDIVDYEIKEYKEFMAIL